MLECKFTLNGKPLSNFEMGAELFPAFSGTDLLVEFRTT